MVPTRPARMSNLTRPGPDGTPSGYVRCHRAPPRRPGARATRVAGTATAGGPGADGTRSRRSSSLQRAAVRYRLRFSWTNSPEQLRAPVTSTYAPKLSSPTRSGPTRRRRLLNRSAAGALTSRVILGPGAPALGPSTRCLGAGRPVSARPATGPAERATSRSGIVPSSAMPSAPQRLLSGLRMPSAARPPLGPCHGYWLRLLLPGTQRVDALVRGFLTSLERASQP
jgi:hypothetical protein